MTKTAIDKVHDEIIEKGNKLTAKQIAHRYNVSNPRDIIYRLRKEGYDIVNLPCTDSKGRVKNKYFINEFGEHLFYGLLFRRSYE